MVSIDSAISKLGIEADNCIFAAHSMGPAYKCGATCALNTSAIAEVFFVSQIPPARPRAGWIIEAPPDLRTSENSIYVVNLSPVAIGISRALCTLLNSDALSGGIGSSNHIGE